MLDSLQRASRALAAGLVWLVALAVWPADNAQAAVVRVTAVSLQEEGGELQVSIATSGPASYQQRDIQPQWVVVDLLGANLGIPAGTLPQRNGQILRVRVGQFTPDVVRVVVELTNPVRARLLRSPNGTTLIIRIPATGTRGQTTAVAPGPIGSNWDRLARVTGITLWGQPSKPWLSITASGPVQYRLRNIEPDWVVVDVSKAQLALVLGTLPAGRGLVKQIRAGQFAPDTVRVIVELFQHVPVHIAYSPDRAVILMTFAAEANQRREFTGAQGAGAAPAPTSQQSAYIQAPAGAQAVDTTQPAAPPHPVTGGQPAASRPPESGAPSIATSPATLQNADRSVTSSYLLGPEDVLEVTVWGYPDMTRVVTVRPDGQVAVPLAGTVPAAGRSVERLTRDLTRAFAKYIINPQVTVIVKEFRKIHVSVLGQVTHPGAYTLPPGARVLDAVSAASGVTDNAALPQAQLVRASGETRPLSLDGLLLQQDMSQNVVVEPGDTIIIPEDTKNKFYVVGDVNHPGIYPLKGDVTVLQALATAGGPVLHGTSTSSTVHIVRRADPGRDQFTAGAQGANTQPIANGNGVMVTMDLRKMMQGDLRQNAALRPGDVLVVPAPGVAMVPTILSFLSFLWWFRP